MDATIGNAMFYHLVKKYGDDDDRHDLEGYNCNTFCNHPNKRKLCTANEMKVFCSNPNLKYFQILRCRVRVSPRNLSFLENSIKDAIFLPKSSHFRENFKKTTEYFQVAILEPPFGD